MRRLGKWFLRALAATSVLVVFLLAPVAYVEVVCRGTSVAENYTPLIVDPIEQRAEAKSYLTYPEWHIVHAYDDYGRVIETGDPHDFGFVRAVSNFWSSLCALSRVSAAHGGFPWETKQMVYTIGVSFNLEMAMKALYEETLGRAATWLRGPVHSPLDELSARQAAAYAKFLQQVPWYRWDFATDKAALQAARTGSLRDTERALALGLEYGAKQAYAGIIAQAVATVGADRLTIRSIVAGLTPAQLQGIEGVSFVAVRPEGVEIATPRYRSFTRVLLELARRGGDMVEIAGNDDIMLTALSSETLVLNVLFRFPRQGYGDSRYLIDLKVRNLLDWIRRHDGTSVRLEHVHDY